MRLSAIWSGALLLESLLNTTACRREAPPTPAPMSTPTPAVVKPPMPTPPPIAPPPPEVVTQVMQKGLPTSGFRIDPEGKYAAVIVEPDAQKCDVWRLEEGAYAGQVPAARCRDWQAQTFIPLDFERDKLTLPSTRVVHSPDGKLRAQARKTAVEIWELATDKLIAKLPIVENDEVFIDTLRWGARGIIFITDVSKRGSTMAHLAAYHFQGPPFGKPHLSQLGGVNLYSRSVLIDPTGRFIFVPQHLERVGDSLHVVDLQTGRVSGLSQPPPRNVGSAFGQGESRFERGRWQDATRPYFQTMERLTSPDGDNTINVTWRILAAPGDRRLFRLSPELDKDLNPAMLPSRKMNGKVMTAQAASALKQQFTGLRFDTLRRISDGEELTFSESGCANSKRGAFSCGVKVVRERVYLLGSDPLTSPIIRGDQIASLLYDPQLIDHFFDGAKLPPQEVPRLGAVPRLELRSVKYIESPRSAIVEVVAHDGGDGVSQVRVVRSGKGQNMNLPAVAEEPITLKISVSKNGIVDRCEALRIYACNSLGHLCSRPQLVMGCDEISRESREMDGQEPSLEDLED